MISARLAEFRDVLRKCGGSAANQDGTARSVSSRDDTSLGVTGFSAYHRLG
jgi:hypothetical protein